MYLMYKKKVFVSMVIHACRLVSMSCLVLYLCFHLPDNIYVTIYITYLFLGRFIQEATGPSIVCVGSSVIFNCTVEVVVNGVNILINAQWRRDGVVITDSTPVHTLIRTQPGTSPIVTAVMVDNTTLSDNGIVYTCTADNAPDNFTSNVILNVTGGTYVIAIAMYCIIKINANQKQLGYKKLQGQSEAALQTSISMTKSFDIS